MTERRTSPPVADLEPDGSAIPARLRIVGWIVLATSVGLLAVVLTVRSALLAEVENDANANVAQEIDEFRTFAERARDPDTGQPVADAHRLLTLYLERQFAASSEVLLGYDRAIDPAVASPLLVQAVEAPYDLAGDDELVAEMVDGDAEAGLADLAGEDLRWGRVEIAGGAGGVFVIAQFLGPARDQVADVVRLITLVCLGGLLLTAAIAFAVAGQILAPVRTVRQAARRITRTDLSERIAVRGRDDVAALAVTFNAMLDRLQGAFRAQRDFSRAAGEHLRAGLDVLADPATTPDRRAAALTEIRETLHALDILALSQDPDFVSPAPVDLGHLTDQLERDVAGLGDRAWLVQERGHGSAEVDLQRVREAVRSLAVNALGQPPTGSSPGPLRLGTRVVEDRVEVYVSDDGPGLTPERAARVLDRYGDTSPERTEGSGPGLGLAVVRAVADGHRGSAWVETEPGAGATFGLSLPVGGPR